MTVDNKKNDVLASIVIPVYKVENYLEECIESVINQTYENIEIILVDDGSPDKCPEICDNYAKKYKNITTYHKKNGGLSDARNYGLTKVKGKYIVFLDSDDYLDRTSIERYIDIAEKTGADIVMPDRYYKIYDYLDKKELCFHFSEKERTNDPKVFATNVIVGKGSAWRAHSVLYLSSLIKNNMCIFPKGYTSEDIIFNLQVMQYAQRIEYCNYPTLFYRKREGSITNTFNKDFLKTILFIDNKVEIFFDKIDIKKETADAKRSSLLSRNVIVYLIGVFNRKNRLSSQNKHALFNEIVNNEQVKLALMNNMELPYFNSRITSIGCLVIHKLLKYKLYSVTYIMLVLINYLR